MRMFSPLFSVVFIWALSLPLLAQREIVIEGRGSGIAGIEYTGFNAGGGDGRAFYDTLRRNLEISGYFRETPPSGAQLSMRGEAVTQGEQLRVMVEIVTRGNNQRRFARGYAIESGRGRALARRVADEIVKDMHNAEGFARKRIIFVGTPVGQESKELYAVFPDGGDQVQLTRFGSVVLGPRWTPDGESVVYTSYHRRFPEVVRQNLRTGALDILSSSSGMNAGGAISPDGRYSALILSRDGRPELYVKDLRSQRLARLTTTPPSAKSSPSWSPDGRQIVFVSGHQGRPHLYVVGRDGGEPSRITRGGAENLSPVWGKNGQIAFTRRVGRTYQTAILDPRTQEIQIVSPEDANYEDPSWAPNGRHLVVTRTINNQSSLYLLDTRGTPPIPLLRERGNWYMPTWSP